MNRRQNCGAHFAWRSIVVSMGRIQESLSEYRVQYQPTIDEQRECYTSRCVGVGLIQESLSEYRVQYQPTIDEQRECYTSRCVGGGSDTRVTVLVPSTVSAQH
ncbi:hypothetical protein J6590_084711 [Homalodisca vitripennis]|nr:hypothetical protein J6590_084711 [Homalodisca vitripennis]